MNALECNQVRDAAPEMALGVLDAEVRSEVLVHLDACVACRRLVRDLSETADSLVLVAPEAEPSAGFERRVLGAVDDSARQRGWRTVKLLAVTAAAAMIVSVVAVRVIDRVREPATPTASTVQRVSMVGDDGQKVGRVDVVADGELASLDLAVDYALPDGRYQVVLESASTRRQPLGVVDVVNSQGSWSGTARVSGAAVLSLVDDSGRTRCSAALPAP